MPQTKADNKKVNFARDLAELEAIVEWFESGEADLDAALPKFEKGMVLATNLKQYLETMQTKVEVIKQRFDQPTSKSNQAD